MLESTLPKKRLDKPIGNVIEECERNIVNSLLILRVIGIGYTGTVTIHLNQGGISDYEKNEKGLRKRINLKG
jgi:hypothetical protein